MDIVLALLLALLPTLLLLIAVNYVLKKTKKINEGKTPLQQFAIKLFAITTPFALYSSFNNASPYDSWIDILLTALVGTIFIELIGITLYFIYLRVFKKSKPSSEVKNKDE